MALWRIESLNVGRVVKMKTTRNRGRCDSHLRRQKKSFNRLRMGCPSVTGNPTNSRFPSDVLGPLVGNNFEGSGHASQRSRLMSRIWYGCIAGDVEREKVHNDAGVAPIVWRYQYSSLGTSQASLVLVESHSLLHIQLKFNCPPLATCQLGGAYNSFRRENFGLSARARSKFSLQA
jgi:hypothetical protein